VQESARIDNCGPIFDILWKRLRDGSYDLHVMKSSHVLLELVRNSVNRDFFLDQLRRQLSQLEFVVRKYNVVNRT
jgi:hypothetical protein